MAAALQRVSGSGPFLAGSEKRAAGREGRGV